MSCYRDFPVSNDVNIQTHFQLEKHSFPKYLSRYSCQNMSTKYGHKNMSVKNVSAKCGNHLMESSSYRDGAKTAIPITTEIHVNALF